MTWVAVGGTAVSVIGGALSGKSAAKKQKAAQAQMLAQQQAQALQQRQWNLEDWNMTKDANAKITDQNWNRQLEALDKNRIDQTSDFGGITYDQDGNQVSNIAPELQAKLGNLRGQYDTNIEQLGQKFDENSPVYQALRNQQMRGRETTRSNENARLAAMGLSTGSGQAWKTAQEAQNLGDVQAEESAWLGGLNAFNSTQANARNNLGALSGLETSWNKNAQDQPDYWNISPVQQGMMSQPGQASVPDVADSMNWGQQVGDRAQAGGNAMWSGIGQLTSAGINAYNRRPQTPYQDPTAIKPTAGGGGYGWDG